ncbi:hypothetical protein M7I_6714 [Glarea lozoyensis 74030]|uniref:Uncharacterized protein n=1 Tax=Glarea lozoyensis (strain ATCC 74030 / MF5533) TaxID=1104152 RepID=H0EVB8_GLAL7|nr:hypothetical protein M7I_6714 [Glarea lozoyensis 74030]
MKPGDAKEISTVPMARSNDWLFIAARDIDPYYAVEDVVGPRSEVDKRASCVLDPEVTEGPYSIIHHGATKLPNNTIQDVGVNPKVAQKPSPVNIWGPNGGVPNKGSMWAGYPWTKKIRSTLGL